MILALFWKRKTNHVLMADVIAEAATIIVWQKIALPDDLLYDRITGLLFQHLQPLS